MTKRLHVFTESLSLEVVTLAQLELGDLLNTLALLKRHLQQSDTAQVIYSVVSWLDKEDKEPQVLHLLNNKLNHKVHHLIRCPNRDHHLLHPSSHRHSRVVDIPDQELPMDTIPCKSLHLHLLPVQVRVPA
jgi:hypothetical protein